MVNKIIFNFEINGTLKGNLVNFMQVLFYCGTVY